MKERHSRVVIVGGSFAGRTARRLLQNEFDVVVLDAKGYFEYVPSTLRCFVEPEHAKNVILPQPEDTRIAAVAAVHSHGVELTNGETVEFDYCLICTGSIYAEPIRANPVEHSSMGERIREIQGESLRLADAKRIVVVGGGTVGVELAAEIAGKFTTTKQTILITSHDCLLERMPEKAQSYAKRWMEQHGVEIIFNDRVVNWESPLRTESGREIEADIVYKCIGCRPNSEIVTPDGNATSIPVDTHTLQWRGHENVFACGDCTSTPEEKTAFAADLSARLAAKNILRHSKNQSLLSYPRAVCQGRDAVPAVVCVSLYKHDGILQINGMVITGFLAAMTKGQIEYMQLAVAREKSWANYTWNIMETVNLWVSKLL